MKNQYVADINDYRKYGLLRALSGCGEIRTGVCWMLTQNDNRADGKFTQYLDSPEKWKQFEPHLFDHLVGCIKDGERTISRVETTNILPNTVYHSDLLSDIPEERSRYFAKMHKRLQGVELIFFDPDNGLEIKSRPYGCKQSAKYLYWHELTRAFSTGKSILVYQHFIREKREQFITRLSLELCTRLDIPRVLSFRTPHVVFFLVSQTEHSQYFEARAAIAAEKWRGQLSVSAHS